MPELLSTRHWEPPLAFSEADLLELYHVAAVYLCPIASDWVVKQLESLKLRPSRMLGLAIELGISAWVRPVVMALAEQPAYLLTNEERTEMGFDVALSISNSQLMLMTSRSQLGCIPPPLSFGWGHSTCQFYGDAHDKSPCAEAWDKMWYNVIRREMLNPNATLSANESLNLIHSTDFVGAGVSPMCVNMGLQDIHKKFEIETLVWDKVIDKVNTMLAMGSYNKYVISFIAFIHFLIILSPGEIIL